MSQFWPAPACLAQQELDRALTPEEHRFVTEHAQERGFRYAYVQRYGGGADFMPAFHAREVFRGKPIRKTGKKKTSYT